MTEQFVERLIEAGKQPDPQAAFRQSMVDSILESNPGADADRVFQALMEQGG